MEFPSLNTYLNPPYPPFIVPVPRGMPFTDKDGKPTIPNGSVPPTIPYGVPYFPPPPGQPGPPPNSQAAAALFAGHPYPMIGNYLPPQYHRFYQDAHFLYFPPEMKLPSKFTKHPIEQMAMMPRDNRLAVEKKLKKKPRGEVKEEKEQKKEKPKKVKKKANYCICEQPEDGKFMVGCDVCDNWFHPKCVNISKKVAKTLDYFVCPHCKDFVPEEDRLQALEHQQPKKKARKESSPSKDEEEGSFDFLEQLSHAAMQAMETGDKEEKKVKVKVKIEGKTKQITETERPVRINFKSIELLDSARIELSKENIFSVKETEEFLQHLISNTPWEQEQIQLYGTTYNEPRLTAWYGDTYCNYVNHGVTRNVLPWTEELLKIKSRVEEICECNFNNMLLNYYRNGEDYMGFHDELVVEASKEKIASVSIGSDRNFIVKHRNTDEVHTIKIHNGSLLTLIGDDTAKHYIYSVPKSRSSNTGPRINIMLRNVQKNSEPIGHITEKTPVDKTTNPVIENVVTLSTERSESTTLLDSEANAL